MKLVETLLNDWQRLTCSHQWVRARWQDGSYGLRCSNCMKPYRHTWDEIIAGSAQPRPAARVSSRLPISVVPSLNAADLTAGAAPESAPPRLNALRRAA